MLCAIVGFSSFQLISTLYYIDNIDCATLESDLNTTLKYRVENCITLNTNKCEHMIISLKNTNVLTYNYLNNYKIAKVSSHKHLDVIYDL